MEISGLQSNRQLSADGASKRSSGKLAGRASSHRNGRAPAEQVLEGELLDKHRRQAADDVRQKHRRYYEQVQKAKSSAISPQVVHALAIYLSTAELHEGEYPRYLDVYA